MNKLSQACNFCNNSSEHCCPEADKNYEAEQAKRERELREEDELFNNELARLWRLARLGRNGHRG